MEEKKYYTPTIDEFYVGFEYELYDDHSCEGMCDYYEGELRTWSKEVFYRLLHPDHKGNGGHVAWKMDNLQTSIDEGIIRVKYLDHEDILELGFKHDGGKLSPFGQQIYKSTKEYGFNTGTHYMIYHFKQNPTMVELHWETFSSYSSEVGKIGFHIKNKSELKRLLKQIGYER